MWGHTLVYELVDQSEKEIFCFDWFVGRSNVDDSAMFIVISLVF